MRENIKEKIIGAAIECLEMYGMNNTTIRKIADRAELNSASISYYFDGEKNLMKIVMKQTLANAFDLSQFIEFESNGLKEYLTDVFVFLVNGAFKFPNISKAHLYNIFIENDYNSPVVIYMTEFLEQVLAKIAPKTNLNEKELRQKLFFLMTQVIYFIVSPKLLEKFTGQLEAKIFIRGLVEQIC
jgi:AcrR family transcriptional regulator